MNYFLIAGEASGDIHGANLMQSLSAQDPEARFRYFGGDRMREVADGLVIHYREMAFMGYIEVVTHLRKISRNMEVCKKAILDFDPDVVILIDYPGFNLRMAEYAKKKGYSVFYYISPKLWAWKQYRVKKIKAFVDRMFIILPFEKEFYKKFGIEAEYLGNPVIDEIGKRKKELLSSRQFREAHGLGDKPVIALLPGSRRQELDQHLPVMMSLAEDYPDFQFVIAGAPAFGPEDYQPFMEGKEVKVVFNATYDLLHAARAALVTSGTATLETALMDVPQVVMYRMGKLTYEIGKFFVKVDFISLVNLILGEEAVTELIQYEVTRDRIKEELDKIINDTPRLKQMLEKYRKLKQILGNPGVSGRVAARMIDLLKTP